MDPREGRAPERSGAPAGRVELDLTAMDSDAYILERRGEGGAVVIAPDQDADRDLVATAPVSDRQGLDDSFEPTHSAGRHDVQDADRVRGGQAGSSEIRLEA